MSHPCNFVIVSIVLLRSNTATCDNFNIVRQTATCSASQCHLRLGNESLDTDIVFRRTPKMAPLVPIFPTEDLPSRVQIVHRGFKEKRRKGEPIDLQKCELMELVQYSCNPPEEGILAPGVVKCKPIVRLFRRFVLSCAGGVEEGG